ncbi:MAG: glutathione peroxidase [Leptospiraceae bacterium]|nr:glutathione peroxidase [Leptospiraceae bacterium]
MIKKTMFFPFLFVMSLHGNSIYNFKILDVYGKEFSFEELKGKPFLIVNTASKCGYTEQFKDLEFLYQKYKHKGFKIIAIPSNDFGRQEPLSNSKIAEFCKTNYNTTFTILSKQPVVGKTKHPLFDYLIHAQGESKEVEWNFEKFLVDKSGKVIARFPSNVTPTSEQVISVLEKVLREVP